MHCSLYERDIWILVYADEAECSIDISSPLCGQQLSASASVNKTQTFAWYMNLQTWSKNLNKLRILYKII